MKDIEEAVRALEDLDKKGHYILITIPGSKDAAKIITQLDFRLVSSMLRIMSEYLEEQENDTTD